MSSSPSPSSAPQSSAPTHIVLLRGINVGGKNKLPMKSLVTIFEALGCRNVRTYIQSGNVIFEADDTLAATLPEGVRAAIEEEFGYSIPVVQRTARELAEAVRQNPWVDDDEAIDPKALHVAFLAEEPSEEAIAGLDPERSPGDEYRVLGREIYLKCPKGLARTKLTNAYFDSRLGTVSTVRNWKTTNKLLELASPEDEPS
jgi:uncharacterized protein (DUF1697 family)